MADENTAPRSLAKPAESLKLIYSVMAGVALTDAATEFTRGVQPYSGVQGALTHPAGIALVMLSWAFLVTIIPFFHGAVAYIDTFPRSGIKSQLEQAEFIVGFFLLFFEGIVLVAMAHDLGHILRFIRSFVLLIFVDSLWASGLLVRLRDRDHRRHVADDLRAALWDFLRLNWFAVLPLATILVIMEGKRYFAPGAPTPIEELQVIAYLTAGILTVRTVVDYCLNIRLYAPLAAPEGPPNASAFSPTPSSHSTPPEIPEAGEGEGQRNAD